MSNIRRTILRRKKERKSKKFVKPSFFFLPDRKIATHIRCIYFFFIIITRVGVNCITYRDYTLFTRMYDSSLEMINLQTTPVCHPLKNHFPKLP